MVPFEEIEVLGLEDEGRVRKDPRGAALTLQGTS